MTSGPTPIPAAVTVAACSTSRLMPRRWVSFPARRRTYFPPLLAPVTRKFRLVIPPDSGVNRSSPVASSGKRRSARVRSSRSAPRSSSSMGVEVTRFPVGPLRDHGLAGQRIRLHGGGLATAQGHQVIDAAADQQEPDDGLPDRPRRQPLDRK